MFGVNSRAERGVMQHYISDSIYGLTLAWITSENSTKQLECRHLDSIFFAGPYLLLLCPESTASLHVPSPTACQLLSPTNSLLASRYLFRPRRDFKSKNPLSGFAPKQTKELSAWRATYIVLHQQKKRTCNIVDYAVLANHRIKLKGKEKKDKYLDLARELK